MWNVSSKFLDVITGAQRAVVRVLLLTDVQFGTSPTGGTELPVLGGDVQLSARADVKGTVELTVPGDYWTPDIFPYGNQLFIERGINFGDGTREMVPLGYYVIWDVEQEDAPYGPIRVTAYDRLKRLMDHTVQFPYQIPPGGVTHRYIFERLINGRPDSTGPASQDGYGHGMFYDDPVPITWSYDADVAMVPGGQVVEDSRYEFLANLAAQRECVLVFNRAGELEVRPYDVDTTTVVRTVRPGYNLIRASRSVTREGVKNVVTAYGSDSASPTGYRLAFNNDPNSPLYWKGKFGVTTRYFASPLLKTPEAAQSAAETVLARYTGLPQSTGVLVVPNPAYEPLDVLTVAIGTGSEIHVADEVKIPLDISQPVEIVTRTTNDVKVIEPGGPDPNPDPPPPVDPPPPPPDPNYGVLAAVKYGWGTPDPISDEFNYTGDLDPAKWQNSPVGGMAGHAGNGRRIAYCATVADGILSLHGYSNGDTAWIKQRLDVQYGRWEIRSRSRNIGSSGNLYHCLALIWPTSEQWPDDGEYDWLEYTNPDQQSAEAYLHYPHPDLPVQQEHATKSGVDMTQWHNIAFEWSPSGVKGWVDGEPFFSYSGGAGPGGRRNIQAMPSGHLNLQLDNFHGTGMREAVMEVEFVRYYPL